jgi:hypothetical protein
MEEPLMNDTMQFEHVTSQGYLLDLYNSLGHGAQSVWLVVAFGTNFSHPFQIETTFLS